MQPCAPQIVTFASLLGSRKSRSEVFNICEPVGVYLQDEIEPHKSVFFMLHGSIRTIIRVGYTFFRLVGQRLCRHDSSKPVMCYPDLYRAGKIINGHHGFAAFMFFTGLYLS